MKEFFYEQVVARKATTKDLGICAAIAVAAVVLIFMFRPLLGGLVIVPAAIAVYAIVEYVYPSFGGEYEYTITNNFLDIAFIRNKESRKEKLSIDLQMAKMIAPADSPKLMHHKNLKRLDFSSKMDNGRAYAIIIPVNGMLQNVVIEPDEEMIKIMKFWVGADMYLG